MNIETLKTTRGGFTLVELLVALGAASLLALGIAQIFAVTGQTVAAGRRLSNLQASAAVMERQFRADLSGMTRDGFLLLRSQNSVSVQVSADDEQPRARRIDELLFFSHGQFATQRDPRHLDRLAAARSARIYYGHGLRQTPGAPEFARPELNGVSALPNFGATGPNRLASNWTLLRHVCLLVEPGSVASSSLQRPLPTALMGRELNFPDQDRQIFLQPAAKSIFRVLAERERDDGLVPLRGTGRPRIESGLIDIATTSLTDLRATVMFQERPSGISGTVYQPGVSSFQTFVGNDENEPSPSGVRSRERMKDWMTQALPARPSEVNSSDRLRMRYEVAPPNLIGLPIPGGQDDGQRSDQTMLASSVFLQHCTEFIVEWTFGQVDEDPLSPTYRRLVWYGLQRSIDVNLNGQVDSMVDYDVRPYSDPLSAVFRPGFKRRDGQAIVNTYDNSVAEQTQPWYVRKPLVERFFSGPGGDVGYAFFGYIDPTYAPDTVSSAALLFDAKPPAPGGDLTYDPQDGDMLRDPDTIPWVWPTLLRLTVVLVDPTEPSIEQRFQFILPTPGNPTAALN